MAGSGEGREAFAPRQGTFPDCTCSDLQYKHVRGLMDMGIPIFWMGLGRLNNSSQVIPSTSKI